MKWTRNFFFGWMDAIRVQRAKTQKAREEFNKAKLRYVNACDRQTKLYEKAMQSGNL